MPLKLMTWRGDWHLFAASEAAEIFAVSEAAEIFAVSEAAERKTWRGDWQLFTASEAAERKIIPYLIYVNVFTDGLFPNVLVA
jgi:hypothetical protein